MNSRARRYKKLLRQVARELDEKPAAEVVKHVATFRLLRENLQIRLLEGRDVDPGDLLKVDDVLKQYLPRGKPLSVEVKIVDGITGICPKCHAEIEDWVAPPKPAPSPPPVIDAEPIKEAKPETPALPAPPPRRDPSTLGIHNARLPDGTLARMPPIDESWRTRVGSSGAYDVFQPAPGWGAAHGLPTPPPECFGK